MFFHLLLSCPLLYSCAGSWIMDRIQLTIPQLRVGMSIGHHPSQHQHMRDMRKKDEDITESEKAEAKRRIEGSMDTSDNESKGPRAGKLPPMASMAA